MKLGWVVTIIYVKGATVKSIDVKKDIPENVNTGESTEDANLMSFARIPTKKNTILRKLLVILMLVI